MPLVPPCGAALVLVARARTFPTSSTDNKTGINEKSLEETAHKQQATSENDNATFSID